MANDYFVGMPNSTVPFVNPETGIITQAWFRLLGQFWQQTNGSKLNLVTVITPSGTTGDQTINYPAGRVNIAAGGASITVTNNLVSGDSIVLAVAATNDPTGYVMNVEVFDGGFTINTPGCTNETAFNFLVVS